MAVKNQYKLCVIPGDGIGPEVVAVADKVLRSLGLSLAMQYCDAGYGAYLKHGTPLPDETLQAATDADAVLLGAVTTPPNIPGYFSPVVRLRSELDLFANVRPCFSLPTTKSRREVNFVIIRENTEGLYVGDEVDCGSFAITKRRISEYGSRRVIDFAFKYAEQHSRNKVTLVHKANIMRLTDGLFLRTGQKLASNYDEIIADDILVDACAYKIVSAPESFDVIVTTNMFGDILSDMSAAIVGSLGVAASANLGANHGLFEPVHGSAPDIAGKGIANPVGMLFSTAMLLDYLGEGVCAELLRKAIVATMTDRCVTPDLGGNSSTVVVTDAVLDNIQRGNHV
ncbi:MAG: isocitrate/isopropylmalate dehydrogenase family protein [Gammaproteobacteria bacterium]|nr:isocitrate/isopropylmalate dehydrogenase family protein [Gammaproteobacteria bacterium]